MEESDEIGYCLISPQGKWKPERANLEKEKDEAANTSSMEGYVKLTTGFLSIKELTNVLK